MSQATNWAVPTTGPVTPTTMAQRIKDSFDAELSAHSGATAPVYRQIGTRWCDTATANRLIFKIWDGSAWVVYLTIDTGADSARLTSINPITTLASAATTTLAGVESDSIEITGTTGITSFGVARPGLIRFVRFAGALLLTHSAALLLPAATNITTAAGDALIAISLGSGDWRVLSYSPATIRVALAASRAVTSASSAGDRTFVAADAGRLISLGGASDFTMTFDPAATLGNGWAVDVKATANIIVTLDPSGAETIDGSATITLARGQTCRLVSDGSAIQTVGLQRRIVLDAQTTTAAAGTISMTLPPGYRAFEVNASNLNPTTNSVEIGARLSVAGSYRGLSGDYPNSNFYVNNGNVSGSIGSGSFGTTGIMLGAGVSVNTHRHSLFCRIIQGGASLPPRVFFNLAAENYNNFGGSPVAFNGIVDGFQFLAASGTLQAGATYMLEGVR